MKPDTAVGKNVAGREGPGKHHAGSRGGRRTYESPTGFVENRANRRVRPRRYECDRTDATIGRPDGNPAGTVIAADGRRSATIAGPRTDRRGCPRRNLMTEHAKRRGAAWCNRYYSEIAAVELQRHKFIVDWRECYRVAGRAGRPGRIKDVSARGAVDLNSHGLAIVGRKAHRPAGTDRSRRRQGDG